MNNDMLLLMEKHTDTLIEQTKTKPEAIEYKLNKPMEFIFFPPATNLIDENKWLLAVSSFETTKSVFNITHESITFSITLAGHWISNFAEKTMDEIKNLLELRSQNDFELHGEQVRKKGKF